MPLSIMPQSCLGRIQFSSYPMDRAFPPIAKAPSLIITETVLLLERRQALPTFGDILSPRPQDGPSIESRWRALPRQAHLQAAHGVAPNRRIFKSHGEGLDLPQPMLDTTRHAPVGGRK